MKPSEGQAGAAPGAGDGAVCARRAAGARRRRFSNGGGARRQLARGGAAAAQPVVRALDRVGAAGQGERHADRALECPRWCCWSTSSRSCSPQGVTDAARAAFAESLRAARSRPGGCGWWRPCAPISTSCCSREPAFEALKQTGASLDLGPPGPAELADIVRAPAAAAGLVLRARSRQGRSRPAAAGRRQERRQPAAAAVHAARSFTSSASKPTERCG